MKVLGLIPTRLGSTRLPSKPLLEINGIPLVIHTYKRAKLSKKFDDLIICCDDKKINNIAKSYGAKSIITSKKHENGTERICEVFKKIKKKYDLIVDVQGDEPLINPTHIDKLVSYHLRNFNTDIVVPSLLINNKKNKHLVKVVANLQNDILYLSRQQVPFSFNTSNQKLLKHLSIVSFKPASLLKFVKLKKSHLEKLENIELLRALDNGMKLKTFIIKGNSFSVDVRKDYIEANKYIKRDKVFKLYKNDI